MKVAIVGFDENHRKELADAMENLITQSQCFLFTVVAASPDSIAFGDFEIVEEDATK